jgi:hypothetical protein
MKFQVLDNEVPAQYPYHKVDASWKDSVLKSYIEALNYAHKWLGLYSPGRILKLNQPYDYSGYGDYISIIRIQ